MPDFQPFAKAVNAQFKQMCEHEIFVVAETDIFSTYLAAFPQGSDPMFRKSTTHDCSCCKNFVRNIGHVVSLANGRMETVWDIDDLDAPYDVVAATMAEHIRGLEIVDYFRTKFHDFGTETTREMRDSGVHTWHHFWAKVPAKFVCNDAASVKSRLRSSRDVFERGLKELSPRAVQEVGDLIDQKALYRGEEHLPAVRAFRDLQREYLDLNEAGRNVYAWFFGQDRAARFRNTVIGTLVQDLSEGVELERAVKSFETKVAPTNYKRPTALITPRMIENAVGKLREMGLESAVNRRHARLEDVSVNDVIWASRPAQSHMKDGLTEMLMEEAKPTPHGDYAAAPIGIDEFVKNVLPNAETLKVLTKNEYAGNFVSITAPVDPDAGHLFRWPNNFAWSYEGEAADTIKKRVKSAGGNVQADLRISLAWSNTDDLDIRCRAPGFRRVIHFGEKQGVLDVDMNVHGETREPVENLAFMRPLDGVYDVRVNNYRRRESVDTGFTLEVENDGRLQVFTSAKSPKDGATFACLIIQVASGVVTKIEMGPEMASGDASRQIWGVPTETLVPVSTVLLSPNYWGENKMGNRHWFFMLEGCKNPEPTRGIYNEFLAPALEEHRKVFEILGAKTKCPVAEEQLSGLGFSSTRGDSIVAVASKGEQTRAYNVQM